MKKTVTLIAATLMSTSVAFAETPDFKAVDTTADGVVSAAELRAAFPNLDERKAAAADVDGSGDLTPAEYRILVASLAEGTNQ